MRCTLRGAIGMLLVLVAPLHGRADAPLDEASSPPLDCDNPSPPTGDYDYEVGFAVAGQVDAEDQAFDAARRQLLRRLCGDRVDCSGVAAKVKRWKTGTSRGRLCVMATVLKRDEREWLLRQGSSAPLEAGLRAAALELFEAVEARRKGHSRFTQERPAVAIGEIRDGVPVGGARALWVQGRIEEALQEAGFLLVEMKSEAGGRRATGRSDVLVTAQLNQRLEGLADVFEVAMRGVMGGERIAMKPARCGLDAVRALEPPIGALIPSFRREPLRDPGIQLDIETGRGGKLCEGDRTQITLTTDRTLHVRVFDIYARDGGLVIFPNHAVSDDRVVRSRPLALGGEHAFDVFMVPGSEEERYIVLAAEKPEDLGVWGNLRDTCRLPPELVVQLLDTEKPGFPPRVRAMETGFRVVRDGCAKPPPSAAKKQELVQDLASVPVCRPSPLQ